MWAYLNGIFASLGGCTLPILSLLVTKLRDKSFNKWRFLLEFFIVQAVIFSLINIGAASFYTIFREVQPLILLTAAVITLFFAYTLYIRKPLNIPMVGGIYGIALSPCSVGFAIATAALSTDITIAVLNAFLFSLGIITPLVVIVFLLQNVEPLVKEWDKIEILGVLLLILVAAYLAFLAGSGWRWLP